MQASGWKGFSPVSPSRSPAIDGWRGLAVVLVLLYHAFYSTFNAVPILHGVGLYGFHVLYLGSTGVDLFFFLSAWALSERYAGAQWTPEARRRFWGRGVFRLLPFWYLVLVLMLVWHWAGWTPPLPTPWRWGATTLLWRVSGLWDWTRDPNAWTGIEWSLGVELTFYAVWPWWQPFWRELWHRFTPTGRAFGAGLTVAASWLAGYLAINWSHGNQPWALFWPPTQAACFVLGIWWRETLASGSRAPAGPRTRRWRWTLLGCLWWVPWPPPLQPLLMPLFWREAVAAVHDGPSSLWEGRIGQWLRHWGRRSYTAYFAHWLTLLALWSLAGRTLTGVLPLWLVDTLVAIPVMSLTGLSVRWLAPLVEDSLPRAAERAWRRRVGSSTAVREGA
jgi:peptidoglycan/LPS O-acetylase OafA/YrhL